MGSAFLCIFVKYRQVKKTVYLIGIILKRLRKEKGLQLQSVHDKSDIDLTLLSRIENGRRLPTEEHLFILSKIYNCDYDQLVVQRESDKLLEFIGDNNNKADEILKVTKDKLQYKEHYIPSFQEELYSKPIELESRRYIGNKAKLTAWIMRIIKKETQNTSSFCDLFSGTGVLAKSAIQYFDTVIVNDFLYSNNCIYKAFFGKGEYSIKKIVSIIDFYNEISEENISDNYFSINYGDKYFEYGLSKKIGFIREDIENRKDALTTKEYNILLAILIYNIDKFANTVGHFEAYIKKTIKKRPFKLRMIEINAYENTSIYREDANTLVNRIYADVVYIDPPYNSRQYCRFYHLYENLVKWNKPELFGVALKPKPENMSIYCTTKAVDAFEDLLSKIKARYIVVSYNNTYLSKSNSSKNKISLEDIERFLKNKGKTKVFETNHRFFNTGKTNFKNHKELLFITEVND